VTVEKMGQWALVVEGANTYTPEKSAKARRLRMEREVYRERGVLIAPDFLVNSGGVIFAAQEQLIKTPAYLRIPGEMLGDRASVERWLQEHAEDLNLLAEKRRQAAEAARQEIIHRNMCELVDMLVEDPDLLPGEAAETISIRRAARRESDRTAEEIMIPMPTIRDDRTIRDAAALLVETNCSILAVISAEGELVGVVTDWDVTRSAAENVSKKQPLSIIMQREVVAAAPEEKILSMIRKLEHQEISSMPVVEKGRVLGMVSADLLARRTLLRLLQSQIEP
jgi:glutamate dehydrogenase (NAD(P)+)